MNYETILKNIDDVNQRLAHEYNRWSTSNESYIIDECIWIIQGLEKRLNNLYIQAKKQGTTQA